jgi:hypothetical protein
MDDEPSGHIEGQLVIDLAGNPVWRIVGDGLYSLDGMETIGYISSGRSEDRDY